jgi:hypothetical protein
MHDRIDQYAFSDDVSEQDIRDTLNLAALATESVFGQRRSLAEANFDLDDDRVCWIDASNEVGDHLSKVFGGFVRREFGDRVRSLRTEPLGAVH